MSQRKWSIEEIEAMRLHINDLQQQLEKFQGVRKLAKVLKEELSLTVKNKVLSKNDKSTNEADFFSLNPNFKPYTIKLKSGDARTPLPKILHVIPIFTTGGSQQLVVDLIEGLSDAYTHEVAVQVMHAQQGYVGVPVHHLPFFNDADEAKASIAQLNPDIVHIHYWGQWHEYGTWKWYHNIFQGSIAQGCRVIENCNNPLMPYIAEGIDRYVYVSEYARDTFGIRGLPNQVIYPGSNFSFFQKENTEPDPDTIGMVYRLDRDKLNEFSIDPFIKAVQKRPATKVIIVGGGYYMSDFKQKVADAKLEAQFSFPGYVSYEQLASYYRQLAVFVAPVHKESFGQVTPFAMNMGIPVVAYNVGALEEILVNPDVLVPAQDSEAMAETIVKLLDDPQRRHTIGQFNQERARSLFTVEIMVKEYGQVYKELLQEKKPVLHNE